MYQTNNLFKYFGDENETPRSFDFDYNFNFRDHGKRNPN